ncbi:hypothetical protein [Zhongshania arctica]|uniref:Uncharacterized protein n=1 Tax=Zhongshania arctica TaxID=3238302 RepID=A0ABV3TYF7_9GAMM
MAMVKYWVIALEINQKIGGMLIPQERDGVWLSPNLRAAGYSSAAYIDTEELAKEYLGASCPILEKRYKYGFLAEIQQAQSSERKSEVSDLVRKHSYIIRERLSSGNMRPNKRVENS